MVSVIVVIRLLTDDNDNDDDDGGEGGRDIDGDVDCEATEATRTTTMMIIRMMMAVVVVRMAVVIFLIRNPVHTWLATTQSPRVVVRHVRTIHKVCHCFRFVSFPQLSAQDPALQISDVLLLECQAAHQAPGRHSG